MQRSSAATSNAICRSSSTLDYDEHVQLSVLVTANAVWLGMSRINEFVEVPRGDAKALARALRDIKATAFFADRADAEIAGEGTVAYGDVVKVIDAAASAGFTDWRVTSEHALSARPQL